MTSTAPIVVAALRPAVSPAAPVAISAADDHSTARRPPCRSSLGASTPASALPTAKAVT
jgi:hypothetical protein